MRRKIILIYAILALLGVLITVSNINTKAQYKNRQEAIIKYVYCLKNNFVQRDYCARQLNSDYIILDQWFHEFGFSYKQIGYDLYIIYP